MTEAFEELFNLPDRMKKIIVFITTYERPEMLLNLLKEIKKQGKNFQIKLLINNDCSSANYAKVIAYLKRYFKDFYYYEDNIHRGKAYYYHIIHEFYQLVRSESFDYFIQIPDDIQLVDRFFDRAIQKFDSIRDEKKACLNILNDYGRNGHAVWVPVDPKKIQFDSYTFILSGWVDMAYICGRKYFEFLDFKINVVDKNWSGKPGRSSGVGKQISERLFAAGASIYQVSHSLLIHGLHESVMHPHERKKHPLISNHRKDKVTASLATMPSRELSLEETVKSLLPQVDELHVYLNNFTHIPEFLNNDKISVFESAKEVGDLGDVGKFYTADKIKGYHFTVDDDLIYPSDYVNKLIEQIEKHDRKYIVGLHGRIFDNMPVNSYYNGHTAGFTCLGDLNQDVFVHVSGTGVTAYHTDTFRIGVMDFDTINMADIWFSRKANNENVPILLLKHSKGWIKESQKYNRTQTIYHNCHSKDEIQTEVVNSVEWNELNN